MDIVLGVLTLLCLSFYSAHSWRLREVRQIQSGTNSNQKRIVCYFGSWAEGRDGDSKFTSDDIPGDLCTHVIYAFASLDKNIGIIPLDNNRDVEQGGYDKFITIKEKNPDVKLMLSIGGIAEGPARFSRIAADPMLRSNFVKKGKDFLRQFNFDGIDLAWQWPGLAEGSSASDKDNYLLLVKEMREELQDDFVISIAVPFLEYLMLRGFHLHQLSQYVDFMNVITYNFHEATEAEVNHVAPLYYIPQDTDDTKQLNVDSTIRTYLSLGMDPSKLNLGIPLYGISFILEDASQTDIGSKTEDQGPGHEDRGGEDIYNKYCKKIVDEGWTVKHVNKSAVGPYAFKDNIWLAYDDEDMVKTKAKYAVEKKLGGLVFWSVDIDDFKAICNSRPFPLINAAKDSFFNQTSQIKEATKKKHKDFKFKIHFNVSWTDDFLAVIKALQDIYKALTFNHGDYMLNQTYYEDLVSTCHELDAIDRDFSFFKGSGFCPNITDTLIEISSTVKMTTDLLMEAATAGLTLTGEGQDCKNSPGIAKYFCFIRLIGPAIKDVKIIIYTVKQYIAEIKDMLNDVTYDINYCTEVYNKLPQNEQNVIRDQWEKAFDSTNDSQACQARAQTILERRKHLRGSTTPSDGTNNKPTNKPTSNAPNMAKSSVQASNPQTSKSNQTDAQNPNSGISANFNLGGLSFKNLFGIK